jgi:hypothetical protein
LALSALALGGAARAQVYKCLGYDGRITYSDQACKGVARVSELAIEPNVIDTSADRVPRGPAPRPATRGRDERPTPECERAARELETARKTDGLAPRELRAAYDRVVMACAVAAGESGTVSVDAPRDSRTRAAADAAPRATADAALRAADVAPRAADVAPRPQRPAAQVPQVRVLPLPADAARVPAAN